MGQHRYGIKVKYSNLPEYVKRKINSKVLQRVIFRYNKVPVKKTDIDKTERFYRFRQKEPKLFQYLFTSVQNNDRLIIGKLKRSNKMRIQSILIGHK